MPHRPRPSNYEGWADYYVDKGIDTLQGALFDWRKHHRSSPSGKQQKVLEDFRDTGVFAAASTTARKQREETRKQFFAEAGLLKVEQRYTVDKKGRYSRRDAKGHFLPLTETDRKNIAALKARR